jgi:prepilin-type N-terminal cleavage/methylation domain-containing protein/prepilin-type processing-associated H-X9-DG protein
MSQFSPSISRNEKRDERFLTKMRRSGFTLIELLVVVAIIALLAAIVFSVIPSAIEHANCASCAGHMRGLGIAFMEYAGDNDGQLPGRVTQAGNNKWPVLLLPYVSDPKMYVDPGDPVAMQVPTNTIASNNGNNSSFFFNGFNDLGFYTNPNLTVHLVDLAGGSNLILLGQKISGSTQYYMDFVEPPNGNENDVLNKTAYFGGSNYTFADGSVRYMKAADYNDTMWLVNQNYPIPTF